MDIMVIDDDALILRSLSHHLALDGHTVMTAKDGMEANDLIEDSKTRPDLIICDLLMPNISGLTFITMLRNFHHYSIPVIVMSSLKQGDLLSAQAGIRDVEFIPKPFVISDILDKVHKHVKT